MNATTSDRSGFEEFMRKNAVSLAKRVPVARFCRYLLRSLSTDSASSMVRIQAKVMDGIEASLKAGLALAPRAADTTRDP